MFNSEPLINLISLRIYITDCIGIPQGIKSKSSHDDERINSCVNESGI